MQAGQGEAGRGPPVWGQGCVCDRRLQEEAARGPDVASRGAGQGGDGEARGCCQEGPYGRLLWACPPLGQLHCCRYDGAQTDGLLICLSPINACISTCQHHMLPALVNLIQVCMQH